MNRQAVYEKLQAVFEETFFDDFTFSEELTANDVDEWDSLVHVSLIIGTEKAFGIRFDAGEITSARNVGEMITMLEKHLKK